LFYEVRLKSRPGLERQEIKINSGLNGSGLRYLPVQHDGNQSSSPEEADAIRGLIADIAGSGATWVDRNGNESPITLDDVLIIAPYNAQVFELQERIPGARIGTVDKFQGQEAPDCHLFHGDLQSRGCAARNGVPLQRQPAERRGFASEVHLYRGRVASPIRGRV
jgi:hypothetical protein